MNRAGVGRGIPIRGASCVYKLEARALCVVTQGPPGGASPPTLSSHLRQNYRAFRERRGVSQETLGDCAGLHRTHVGSVCRSRLGQRTGVARHLARLAVASLREILLDAISDARYRGGFTLSSLFSALVRRIGTRPFLAALTKCLFCQSTSLRT